MKKEQMTLQYQGKAENTPTTHHFVSAGDDDRWFEINRPMTKKELTEWTPPENRMSMSIRFFSLGVPGSPFKKVNPPEQRKKRDFQRSRVYKAED